MKSSLELIPNHRPLSGDITLPGSKSFTNRALILAAQADGVSTLRGASTSDDSEALLHALGKIGVHIEKLDESWQVHPPKNAQFIPFRGNIDIGPAGTTMRFLTSLFSSIPGLEVQLQGSARMHDRPIHDLVEALRQVGADITYVGKKSCPPLFIRGKQLEASQEVSLKGDVSSQFLSSLLLSSSRIGNLRVRVQGEQSSRSYLDMTEASLAQFGISVSHELAQTQNNERSELWTPHIGGALLGKNITIEGDASGASYLFALAAISGGNIRVHNIALQSSQGDAQFPLLLQRMGCEIESGESEGMPWIEVRGPESLRGIDCDMSLMPDTAQTLAVLCAYAKGKSRITGLHTLRNKETDRIHALEQELKKFAVKIETDSAEIRIEGNGPLAVPPNPILVRTYDDHRMAMSFAVLASQLETVSIEAPSVVTKSYPGFWKVLEDLGIRGKLHLLSEK